MTPAAATSEPADPVWHSLQAAEVTRMLESHPRDGLDHEEAAKRLRRWGPNSVTARGGTPAWKRLLQQFHQPLVNILLAACAVTGILQEWVDSAVIFGVVVVNAIIGYIQEAKAEKAIEALKRLAITEATVRRGGRKLRVPSGDLVPGERSLSSAGCWCG